MSLKIRLIIIAYLLIGAVFCAVIPDSAGRPMASMIFLWPFYIPIIILVNLFGLICDAAEHVITAVKRKLRFKR